MPAAARAAAAGARTPSDRLAKKPPRSDELITEALDERPDGADLLRPAGTLRARERAIITKVSIELTDDIEVFEAAQEMSDDTPLKERAEVGSVGLDLVTKFDEALEQVAIDPEAYARWATVDGGGPNLEQRIAELFIWYVNAVGE